VFDTGFGLLSYFAVNTALCDIPLRMVLSLVPSAKGRVWSRQATKIGLMVGLVKLLHRRVLGNSEGGGADASVVLWNMVRDGSSRNVT
jgi:hypothetical protein